MSTDAETDKPEKFTPWTIAAAALLLILFSVIGVGVVRGWFTADPQEVAEREKEKEEEEKRKLSDFSIASPVVQPGEPELPMGLVKPGHWAAATQRMRSNYRDFVGHSVNSIEDRNNNPYSIARTPFVLRASRPVALIKGRPKDIDGAFFVPPTSEQIRLSTELSERGLGTPLPPFYTTLSRMPSYQYHFVVLAKEPTRYSFIKSLDSVRVPFDGESQADDTEDPLHYRVVLLSPDQSVPLSDNPLTWTTTAYLLWDEVDPKLFTPEQQRALVDWIHWGGQLIISGPDSLDLLRGSFLEPYLPAKSGGPTTIANEDDAIERLNRGWMVSTRAAPGEPLVLTVPWSAVKLDVDPSESQALPSLEGLLVERAIGRGRIVVSAMHLSERDLVNWRSGFESFFNACILRRPSRQWRPGMFGDATLDWDPRDDPSLASRRLDARLMTRVQFFARDLGVDVNYRYVEVEDQSQMNWQSPDQQPIREHHPPEHVGGLGAWNDFSATANAARAALREAAGVEVPGASFVVICLTAYLIALVPLNWLVFHTMGRVEWAWIAAPLIAVGSTFVVVHQAQLDIDFVRAQTEIGLIELQKDHARGHLSRFTALYTSLSTTYDLEFDNLTTVAAPFSTQADFQMLSRQGRTMVDFQRYDTVRLAGLPVGSNSTNMVHSEQMLSLDGAIRLGTSSAASRTQLENLSQFPLRSVGVVRRPAADDLTGSNTQLEGFWVGEMQPRQSVPIAFRPLALQQNQVPFAEDRAAEARRERADRLNLEPLFTLAYALEHIEPGETRLVARMDEAIPGETVTPAASQLRSATLVVAHLDYADMQPPRPDRNSRRDVMAEAEE